MPSRARVILFAGFLLLAPAAAQAQTNPINTIAGNGAIGDGGAATSAIIAGAQSVALDPMGNIYVADGFSNRIRRVDHVTLNISTFAGTGIFGSGGDGGPATSATFSLPRAVAVDSTGNLVYIADDNGNRIRVVDVSTGIINAFAGTGVRGFSGDGGPALSAQLNHVTSLFVDLAGNLYVSDGDNCVIRKVDTTASHIINTIAGTGTVCGFAGDGMAATSAQLSFPGGVALDAAGKLYIADGNNHVRIVNTSGVINTFAGTGVQGFSGDGGTATSAELSVPRAVAVDPSGNLLIVDAGNNAIRKVASGIITTVAGIGTSLGFSGDGGAATSATLTQPQGIAVDALGNFFIADTSNGRIRRVDTTTKIISTVAGGVTIPSGVAATATPIGPPSGIAKDSAGNLYICGLGSFVLKVDTSGVLTIVAG